MAHMYLESESEPDRSQPPRRESRSPSPQPAPSTHPVKRDRAALKKWLEAKQRKENGNDGASIVSTGDEDISQEDVTDKSYRGRSARRSRVGSLRSETGEAVPDLEIRKSSRRRNSPAAVAQSEDGNDQGPRQATPVVAPPPRDEDPKTPPRNRRRQREFKSAAVVDSDSSDYEPKTLLSIGGLKRLRAKKDLSDVSPSPAPKKTRRNLAPFPLISPLFRSRKSSGTDRRMPSPTPSNPFLDNEAMEEDQDGNTVKSVGDAMDVDNDSKYESSFIDDTPEDADSDAALDAELTRLQKLTRVRLRSPFTHRSSKKAKVNGDRDADRASQTDSVVELPAPGSNDSDRESKTSSSTKDRIRERIRSSVSEKTKAFKESLKTPILKKFRSQESAPPEVLVVPSDSDEEPSKAIDTTPFKSRKANSVGVIQTDGATRSKVRPRPLPRRIKAENVPEVHVKSEKLVETPVKSEKPAKIDTSAPAPSTRKEKGKGRARRSPSPEPLMRVDDDLSDDGSGLEDDKSLSPYERNQIRAAIMATCIQATKTGESSKQTRSKTTLSSSKPVASASSSSSASPSSVPLVGGSLTMEQLIAEMQNKRSGSSSSRSTSSTTKDRSAPDHTIVRRCVQLPDACQVTDPELQDPILQPFYEGLPNLKPGLLIPWTDLPGKGQLQFSAWGSWIPHMNASVALGAVNFKEAGHIRNPARASPLDVAMRTVPGSSEKYNLYCATNPPVPLVAVSPGWLERSNVTAPSGTGLRQKYITVIFHSQEWERTIGFISTASGYPELHAQLARDALQFSSRASPTRAPTSPGESSSRRQAPAGMFKASARSPTTAARLAADNFSLPNDATIPIYDARNLEGVDWNDILPRLSSGVLPLYTSGEIPHGSFVMVGYTMSFYRASSTGNWTLGCNIHWVVLVGTPRD